MVNKHCPLLLATTVTLFAARSALAIDRQRTTAGRLQMYGSQVGILTNGVLPFFPIEDPQDVDERRLRAGLPPLRVYACVMATMYKAAVVLPPGVPN